MAWTPTSASKTELGEYVDTKLHIYEEFSDYTLWSLFQEDFAGWTSENFKTLRNDTRAKLRLHLLRERSLRPPYNNRYPISDALVATLNEEEQHDWTDQELVETLKIVRPMITVTLQSRLNSTLTGLAAAQVQRTHLRRICGPSLPSLRHLTSSRNLTIAHNLLSSLNLPMSRGSNRVNNHRFSDSIPTPIPPCRYISERTCHLRHPLS